MSGRFIPFVPKDPSGVLFVVAIGRISTPGQRAESIDASHRYDREYLKRMYDGPIRIEFLGEQASGMLADRPTIRRAKSLIESGKVDVVIAEDLGRIYRNPRYQYSFVQDCVDLGVRVICVGDHLDTAEEDWQVDLASAVLRHGTQIATTQRQVRRMATYSFHIHEMRDRLMQTKSPVVVVKWLNEAGIPVGPYVEKGMWTVAAFRSLMCDELLSGTRTYGKKRSDRIFKTGRPTQKAQTQKATENRRHAQSGLFLSRDDVQSRPEEALQVVARSSFGFADLMRRMFPNLKINHMIVKRAFDYFRLMEREGMAEPYRELHACPEYAFLVVSLLNDPILGGVRTFRDTFCRPIYRTGKSSPWKGRPRTWPERLPQGASWRHWSVNPGRFMLLWNWPGRTKPSESKRRMPIGSPCLGTRSPQPQTAS